MSTVRVSLTHGNRLTVLFPGNKAPHATPMMAAVSVDGTQITLWADPKGFRGGIYSTGKEWSYQFSGIKLNGLKPFGMVDANCVAGTDTFTIKLPNIKPAPRKSRLGETRAPRAIEASAPIPTRQPLRELVRELNSRRDEDPDNMVFSISPEGKLVVTVEYN